MVLSDAERQTISELPEHVLRVKRREDIVDGSKPTRLHLLHTGIAGRYTLPGERQCQITAFLIPGDCCDLRALLMGDMDHSSGGLQPLRGGRRTPSAFVCCHRKPPAACAGAVGPTLCSMLPSIGSGWPTSLVAPPTPGLLTSCVRSGSG